MDISIQIIVSCLVFALFAFFYCDADLVEFIVQSLKLVVVLEAVLTQGFVVVALDGFLNVEVISFDTGVSWGLTQRLFFGFELFLELLQMSVFCLILVKYLDMLVGISFLDFLLL